MRGESIFDTWQGVLLIFTVFLALAFREVIFDVFATTFKNIRLSWSPPWRPAPIDRVIDPEHERVLPRPAVIPAIDLREILRKNQEVADLFASLPRPVPDEVDRFVDEHIRVEREDGKIRLVVNGYVARVIGGGSLDANRAHLAMEVASILRQFAAKKGLVYETTYRLPPSKQVSWERLVRRN